MEQEKNKIEIRSFDEVRAVDNEEGKMIIEGVVNNVGEWSKMIYGSFKERVADGVFKKAITRAKEEKRDIFFLALHNSRSLPLASLDSGTMELKEENKKLKIKAELPDTSQNRDIYALIKAKVLKEFSFRFNNAKSEWSKNPEGVRCRTINELDLREVSIVCIGAYNDTSAEARGYNPIEELEEEESEEEESEEFREAKEEQYQYNKNLLRIRGVRI